QAGAQIASDGRPVYDRETYRTTVPGLYVAGHLTREVHMTPAIVIPSRIVRRIAGQRPSARGAGLAAGLLAYGVKTLRRKSALARYVIRHAPLLRRVVQAIDRANAMHDKQRTLARRIIRRYPVLQGFVQSLRRVWA